MDARCDLFRRADKHLDEIDRSLTDSCNAIENKTAGRRVDQVDHVVQPAAQFVDVFAIKRSNKCLVELGQDGVRDLIAVVLDGFDFLNLFGNAGVMLQHPEQSLRADNDVVGLLVKKVEKALFAWKKAL